ADTGFKDGVCSFVAINVADPGTCDDMNGGCGSEPKLKCACGKYGKCFVAPGEKCKSSFDCAKNFCQKIVGSNVGKCQY
ncbi:MAG: hypothetical protein FJ096_18555, partial [Deltaproteobacteria bacterium]|nr:hypothetical protein [Deltaproteobacteria bacterium]